MKSKLELVDNELTIGDVVESMTAEQQVALMSLMDMALQSKEATPDTVIKSTEDRQAIKEAIETMNAEQKKEKVMYYLVGVACSEEA